MHRFLVDSAALDGIPVRLEGAVAHQMRRVLRLAPGDRVCVFRGDGWEHEAVIEAVTPAEVILRVDASAQPERELPCLLRVGMAILKGEKLDWVVQKLVELGAGQITFLETARVVPAAAPDRFARRLDRYQAIVREAVEQCGRVRMPRLAGPVTLAAFLAESPAAPCLVIDPSGARVVMDALPECPAEIRLAIGPEGGFAPTELDIARDCGAALVTLGPRILRSETAAIAAAVLVAAHFDAQPSHTVPGSRSRGFGESGNAPEGTPRANTRRFGV